MPIVYYLMPISHCFIPIAQRLDAHCTLLYAQCHAILCPLHSLCPHRNYFMPFTIGLQFEIEGPIYALNRTHLCPQWIGGKRHMALVAGRHRQNFEFFFIVCANQKKNFGVLKTLAACLLCLSAFRTCVLAFCYIFSRSLFQLFVAF